METSSETPGFRVDGNADGTVTITTGAPSVTASIADVEVIISVLADLRARHPLQVPMDPPWANPGAAHHRVEAVDNPRFWVQASAMQDGHVLSIRHPGYGWLPFHIPTEHAKTLIALLQQQIDAPQAAGSA